MVSLVGIEPTSPERGPLGTLQGTQWSTAGYPDALSFGPQTLG
jgi:hypothetical protein